MTWLYGGLWNYIFLFADAKVCYVQSLNGKVTVPKASNQVNSKNIMLLLSLYFVFKSIHCKHKYILKAVVISLSRHVLPVISTSWMCQSGHILIFWGVWGRSFGPGINIFHLNPTPGVNSDRAMFRTRSILREKNKV